MKIETIDHLVLTVNNTEVTCNFYCYVLSMEVVTFGNCRKALQSGSFKINLHEFGNEFEPKANHPTCGSVDICFITNTPLPQVQEHIAACGVEIIAGPVTRTGAIGAIESIYLRDPDGNLIEVSNYRNSNQTY